LSLFIFFYEVTKKKLKVQKGDERLVMEKTIYAMLCLLIQLYRVKRMCREKNGAINELQKKKT